MSLGVSVYVNDEGQPSRKDAIQWSLAPEEVGKFLLTLILTIISICISVCHCVSAQAGCGNT